MTFYFTKFSINIVQLLVSFAAHVREFKSVQIDLSLLSSAEAPSVDKRR